MKLSSKQQEFNGAMKKYTEEKKYEYIYLLVSVLNVAMQFYLFIVLFTLNVDGYSFMALFLLSYFVTDFINGYVHLYMDNNENYNSLVGPFIASFHLHHRTPNYREFSIFRIYFNESGSKFWLVVFLIFTIYMTLFSANDYLILLLILVGILSSVAEVSHFLCHNSKSKIVLFLQKSRLLLSMKHHRNHHEKDNQSYAFLNGMSDFLLDKIAKKFYGGYKEKSDLHSSGYEGKDTGNR